MASGEREQQKRQHIAALVIAYGIASRRRHARGAGQVHAEIAKR